MISRMAYTRTVPDRRIPEPCRGFRNLVSGWPIRTPVIRDRFNSDANAPVRLHHSFVVPLTRSSST